MRGPPAALVFPSSELLGWLSKFPPYLLRGQSLAGTAGLQWPPVRKQVVELTLHSYMVHVVKIVPCGNRQVLGLRLLYQQDPRPLGGMPLSRRECSRRTQEPQAQKVVVSGRQGYGSLLPFPNPVGQACTVGSPRSHSDRWDLNVHPPGFTLKLKLQYFGPLMRKANTLERP